MSLDYYPINYAIIYLRKIKNEAKMETKDKAILEEAINIFGSKPLDN